MFLIVFEVYEGIENMKESRQEMLRQNFNMFDYIPGETLEAQLQRFTTLTTEMNIAGSFLTKSEIKKAAEFTSEIVGYERGCHQ